MTFGALDLAPKTTDLVRGGLVLAGQVTCQANRLRHLSQGGECRENPVDGDLCGTTRAQKSAREPFDTSSRSGSRRRTRSGSSQSRDGISGPRDYTLLMFARYALSLTATTRSVGTTE